MGTTKTSAFSTNVFSKKSRSVSVNHDSMPRRTSFYLWSGGPEATNTLRLRALEAVAVSAQKVLKGSKTMTRELLGEKMVTR